MAPTAGNGQPPGHLVRAGHNQRQAGESERVFKGGIHDCYWAFLVCILACMDAVCLYLYTYVTCICMYAYMYVCRGKPRRSQAAGNTAAG